MITSAQDITTWLGLSAMDALATAVQQQSEQMVKDFLGWGEIEQTTWTEYYPMNQSEAYVGDPTYIQNEAHTMAVPQFFRADNALQLRNIPVRSITGVWIDFTGYFGDGANAFSDPPLTAGSDYYLKREQAGISWSGLLVPRTFLFPTIPGSVKVQYVSGFTNLELTGRWSMFKTAVQLTVDDLYMHAKAMAMGHRGELSSETDGDGVSVAYYRSRLGDCTIPDKAADILEPYVFYGEGTR